MSTEKESSAHAFGWLNTTQFLGALNDNIFRWLLLFALIGTLGGTSTASVSQIIGVVFVIPFLLFTPWAGKLADRYSKTHIIRLAKGAEILVMGLGLAALAWQWTYGLYGVLFLMCVQSAFFGPSKYGIVPELVPSHGLSRANALLSGWTYLAIVVGTALAGLLSELTQQNYAGAALVCVVISLVGMLTSLRIPISPARAPHQSVTPGLGGDVWRTLRCIRGDSNLLLAVLASAYFTLLAGFLQMNLIPYGMDHLLLTREHSTYLFLIAAVGIGIGSWGAGRLSGRHVEVGLVPLGAIGLACGAFALALLPAGRMVGTCIFVVLMGISAGLFIVPIRALIQLRSPEHIRGEVVAASSFLGWVGVLSSAGLLFLLDHTLGLSSTQAFAVLGALTVILAGLSVWRLPDFLVRFVIVVVIRGLYRIRVFGDRHVPQKGGALLVANHISYVDALLIAATQQRRIRFIMSRPVFEASRFQWLFRLMQTILISESDPPKQIIRSLKTARQALDDGYLVCIFAEGAITRNGTLRRFKPGMERILKGSEHPVIPVYLGGLWGSIFSFAQGKTGGWPHKLPYPVNIHFGAPHPASTQTWQARQHIQELSCDEFEQRKAQRQPLAQTFIKVARRHWRRRCISDRTGKQLTYGRTLTGAVLLSRRLRTLDRSQKPLGILLPPSAGGALANIACTLLRRPSANLNYTLTVADLRSQLEHCGIRQVLSARAFVKRLGWQENDLPFVFIEDLLADVTISAKLRAALAARLAPWGTLCPARDFNPDEITTILFSSGSSDRAKAIMLSHHNLLSHMEQMRAIFPLNRRDHFCGILPLFHSFGLNITFWLPITSGNSVDFVPNPLDHQAVAASVRETQATVLMSAPTFLLSYLRRIPGEDFASLERVIVGAEKMKPRLADLFEKRFGVRPREGYGATELSPAISFNLPDILTEDHEQPGTLAGSAGLALPGMALKVVNPDTGVILPPNQEGLLWTKGPNVMQGYWGDPARTEAVLQDGWYNTGDIVRIDEHGFITITDRLSRFSKIGGEMVSHGRVEEFCHAALDASEPVLAITGIPDERKGEKLVVLYTPEHVDPDRLFELLCTSDLPNLSKPKRCDFVPVDSLPLLGSGKLNLRLLKQMAVHRKGAQEMKSVSASV